MTRRCTAASASELSRRVQNRQSSAKLRSNGKAQFEEMSERVRLLGEENRALRVENEELRAQNVYCGKKIEFYKRTLAASLQQNEESDCGDDMDIVCEQRDDKYIRINSGGEKQKFVKNFLCLTVLTVLLQLIDVDVQSGAVGSDSGQLRLKSLDIAQVSQSFISRMISALPTTLFFAKNLLLIVWIVVLVMNYKRIVK